MQLQRLPNLSHKVLSRRENSAQKPGNTARPQNAHIIDETGRISRVEPNLESIDDLEAEEGLLKRVRVGQIRDQCFTWLCVKAGLHGS